MTLDLVKQKIKGHSFCGESIRQGAIFYCPEGIFVV